jgi:uncharacterized membrane protein
VQRRVAALDAARGAAMLLVCLSHFTTAYLVFHNTLDVRSTFSPIDIGYVASPTFILISGFVIGYLVSIRPDKLDHYHRRLLDRGLVLLTVGHVWLGLTEVLRAGSVLGGLRMGFITDVIGVCLLIMVPLSRHLSPRHRFALGLGVMAASFAWAISWHPTGPVARAILETLFGSERNPVRGYTFPILPWLGLYLACSALGAGSARLLQANRVRTLGARFVAVGVTATATVALIRLLHHQLLAAGRDFPWWLELATSPWSKIPPSPGYMLFFGGLGAVMIGLLLLLPPAAAGFPAVRALRLLGRNSLFVYLFQNLVFFVLVLPLGAVTGGRLWPLPLAASLLLVVAAAAGWEAIGGNQWLTFKIRGSEAPQEGRAPN